MPPEESEVMESVHAAIEAHRTDVLKAVIDTVKKSWKENEFNKFLNRLREQGTLLHWVAKENQADMVRLLLSYGADPSIPDGNGQIPLSLTHDTHTKSAFNDALFASIAQHEMATTEKLFLSTVDEDIRDNKLKQNTPLHWAVSFSNRDAVRFLIERGASLDPTNSKGLTPLHEAVQLGNCDIVELLVKSGCNVNFPVQGASELKGKTALDLAPPESPVRGILYRYSQTTSGQLNGPTIKVPSEVNGHANGYASTNGHARSLHSSLSQLTGPLSPGNESVFSTDEISAALPFIRPPVRPVITDSRLHWLWPPPKQMQQLDGPPFSLSPCWSISFVRSSMPLHEILDVWDSHKLPFAYLGVDPVIGNVKTNGSSLADDGDGRITCCVNARLFANRESYRLTVSSEKISITSSDGQGLHYALSTLEQLVYLCQDEGHLPPLHIEDSPSLRMRAIFLDVSPTGRVPLLDDLFSMIDAWRFLKLNQVHLYSRVNCSSGLQWPWPYTKTEIISLDRYCLDRGMELVPTLDVEGDIVESRYLEALISRTRSCFSSSNFFHAGPNLTSLLVATQPPCLSSPDVTWLLCANSIREKKVPSSVDPGCVLVEYGFQADYNFHEKSQSAWADSAALCFCAGTASWDCLSGYPEAAAANILHAAQAAVERGSLGSIAATWTDSVALGSLHFAWPGWIIQAGLSWNPSVHWDFIQNSLGDLLSLWILNEPPDRRPSIGTAVVELGRLETWLLRYSRGELDPLNGYEATSIPPSLPPSEGSIHYRLLIDPDNVGVDHLNMECVVRAIRHSKKWHKLLTETAVTDSRYHFTKTFAAQAVLTADFLLLASRILRGILTVGTNPNSNMGVSAINLGVANLSPTLRTDAANRLLSLTERFQKLWAQQYQVPTNGFNSVVTALNASIHRLLAHVETAEL